MRALVGGLCCTGLYWAQDGEDQHCCGHGPHLAGGAGGSQSTTQRVERQCGGPLSGCWSYFAGKAAK